MNKESGNAGMRPSAIAERFCLREEWSALKGTEDSPAPAAATKARAREPNRILDDRDEAKPGNSTCDVLRGVVALVEVGAEPRALPLRAVLTALGATVTHSWNRIVTHLVWAKDGCRTTRRKARDLGCRLVSPLWVEACASAERRIPEQLYPAAVRASDPPTPKTLRVLLQRVDMENIPLADLLPDRIEGSDEESGEDMMRLWLSTDISDTSEDKSDDTDAAVQSYVNTARRRAVPPASQPEPQKLRKKSQKTAGTLVAGDIDEDKEEEDSSDDFETAQIKHITHFKDQKAEQTRVKSARRGALPSASQPASRRQLRSASKSTPRRQLRSGSKSTPRRQLRSGSKSTPRRQLRSASQPVSRRQLRSALQSASRRKLRSAYQSASRTKLPAPTRSRRKLFTQKEVEDTEEDSRAALTWVAAKTKRDKKTVRGAKRKVANGKAEEASMPRSTKKAAAAQTQPIVVLTGMAGEERRIARDAVRSLGGLLRTHVTKMTTHVLLGSCTNTLDTFKGGRTLSALAGAARGCLVLHSRWALDAAAAGHWPHHHGYEVSQLLKMQQYACLERKAFGLLRSEYAYELFAGKRVHVARGAQYRDETVYLLNLCGADVVHTDSDTSSVDTEYSGECDYTIGTDVGEISSAWVFDSMTAARVKSIRTYLNE